MLEGAYAKGQAQSEQMRRDLQQGAARARAEAEQKKAEMEATDGDRVSSPSTRLT